MYKRQVHVLVFLQSVYSHLLDGCVIQTEFLDDVCIEEYLIVHNEMCIRDRDREGA